MDEMVALLAQAWGWGSGAGRARLVVVHGAGSYGHGAARRAGLSGGVPREQERAGEGVGEGVGERMAVQLGAAETRGSVGMLNVLFVRALVAAGVPAVSVSPWACDGDRAALVAHVARLVAQGWVPVVHGDVVGSSAPWILSGDVVMEWLACDLAPRKTIFLTDVAGVYDDDPKLNPDATHYPTVSFPYPPLDQNQPITLSRGGSDTTDVTGGLDTKVKAAATIANYLALPVTIMHASHARLSDLSPPSQAPSSVPDLSPHATHVLPYHSPTHPLTP